MSNYNNNFESPERNNNDDDFRKLNEIIIKKYPNLATLNERIIYDKEFLLEVQSAGYNPLDAEDVQNFLEKKSPKNEERNMILAGVDKYKYLGQGEYEEDDLKKYIKKTGAETNLKKPTNIYTSDLSSSQRELLMENLKDNEIDLSDVILDKSKSIKYKNLSEAEETLRKNMAKAFGSDDIDIKRSDIPKESNQLSRQNDSIDKMLELIKELKALGFTAEEIKKELKLRSDK